MTRQEIRANREKWIALLCDPMTLKGINRLDSGHGSRCCLGHGCVAVGIPGGFDGYGVDEETETAPNELIDAVGLWTEQGASKSGKPLCNGDFSLPFLTMINDETDATPQQIGAYLASVIEGGPDTPFRPLSDYPDKSTLPKAAHER